jgi:hypothetical protein
MLVFLDEMKENENVYSFGKVTEIIDERAMEVQYKSKKALVRHSTKNLAENEWVRLRIQ